MELTRPDGSPLRVLVVDDEVNIAELVSMALRYEGFAVQQAHTGSKAVSVAREFEPDAVVLDMMLPDFDGLEVLRRLRAAQSDVPVVFLDRPGRSGGSRGRTDRGWRRLRHQAVLTGGTRRSVAGPAATEYGGPSRLDQRHLLSVI